MSRILIDQDLALGGAQSLIEPTGVQVGLFDGPEQLLEHVVLGSACAAERFVELQRTPGHRDFFFTVSSTRVMGAGRDLLPAHPGTEARLTLQAFHVHSH